MNEVSIDCRYVSTRIRRGGQDARRCQREYRINLGRGDDAYVRAYGAIILRMMDEESRMERRKIERKRMTNGRGERRREKQGETER